MKNIFRYLSLVVAIFSLTLVACNDEPAPEQPKKEYALEITSDAVMEFTAEGGASKIVWALNEVTRNEPVMHPEVILSAEAEWITIDPDMTGIFIVAKNVAEAREAVITIKYREQEEIVTVKQAAPVAEVEAIEFVSAVRLSCEAYELPWNNFAIAFEDATSEYQLALLLVGAEGDEMLAEGVYSAENGGLDLYSGVLMIGLDEYEIAEGVVEVALDGEEYDFDITITTTDGDKYIFVYTGEVENMVQVPAAVEPVAFSPLCVKAERYMIGNFFLQLYIDDTRYHELDMYDEIHPNDDLLSAGTYTYAAEAISTWSTFSTGYDQTCSLADAEITLAHNEDNTTTITGFIKSEQGDYITIDWTGAIEGFIYEKETGLTFEVEALSAEVYSDKAGQKDILFMVDEYSGHVFSFKGADIVPVKPLADGEYSSEAGTIDITYCVHGYGDGYKDMTSAKATVKNDIEAGTTSFDIEWEFEGNFYKMKWTGPVVGITYKEVVELVALDFDPVYVEMVRISSSDKYFYFYDSNENELVCELYNGKIFMPYINYNGVKRDISTEDYTFELDEHGLGKNDGVRSYNVRFVTLDGHLIEFNADLETYVNY